MEIVTGAHQFPNCATQQHASVELVKRIRKLRWIGMEEEAERLQIARSISPLCDCVIAEPPDTD